MDNSNGSQGLNLLLDMLFHPGFVRPCPWARTMHSFNWVYACTWQAEIDDLQNTYRYKIKYPLILNWCQTLKFLVKALEVKRGKIFDVHILHRFIPLLCISFYFFPV
jgi:hypothetical protein